MAQRFPSRRDGWITAVLMGSAILDFAIIAWALGQLGTKATIAWLTIAAVFPVALLTLWLLYGTYYEVSRSELLVRAGPFRWRIPLASIRGAERTQSPLYAPALSLDRIRISYEGGRELLVSPDDQRAFLAAIGQTAA
jgi:hypothetical protein